MKKSVIAIALLTLAGIAAAVCPPYTRYDCTQMPNGKMNCGCK